MAGQIVHVDIHGQRYAVRSDLNPQYIADLAGFLDEKMRAAARELSTTDALRIAVIAALNVSDELFRLREDASGADGQMRARTAELERLVDAVLEAPEARVLNG